MPASRSCRVALYSHDTMGIGHMRRNLLIAQALVDSPLRPTVLLVAGAREAAMFRPPPRVDLLTLPSLCKSSDGAYGSRSLEVPLADLIRMRSRALRGALEAFEPDLLVVDKVPRGALGELDPALQALHAAGRTKCVLGLRDVLDEPEAVRREWAADGSVRAIRDYYDAVWVYGSPAVYDLVAACRLPADVAAKVRYTGYLNRLGRGDGTASVAGQVEIESDAPGRAERPGREAELPAGRFVLCMVGGGQDGAAVAEAFARARPPKDTDAVVVTGPFMPDEARRRLRERAAARGSRLRVIEFVDRPDLLIRRADRVVTMGGYNTVCEVLAAGKHGLVVPRVRPRREQLIRAQRLQTLGLLDVLEPDDATPEALSRWLARDPAPPRRPVPLVDFNGLTRLAELAAETLRGTAATGAPFSGAAAATAAAPAAEVTPAAPRLGRNWEGDAQYVA